MAWPVLSTYDQQHLYRIGLPLGGIGTGTISLGGRGQLEDFEIVNRPAKGFTPDKAFFALYCKPAKGAAVTRALEGPFEPHQYGGGRGARAHNANLPRFARCTFKAAYPLGQVELSDPDVPLRVRLEAFNPFVPPDTDASGIPIAVLRYVLINPTRQAVTASVCGSLPNFIGEDGRDKSPAVRVNKVMAGTEAQGVLLATDPKAEGSMPKTDPRFGTLALATTARSGVSCRTAWDDVTWGDALLDFWDDFSADGMLDEPANPTAQKQPASLAVKVRVPAKSEKSVTFLIAWHFPNRQTWTRKKPEEAGLVITPVAGCDCGEGECCDPDNVGNYYTTRYRDAWDVVTQTAPVLAKLEQRTVAFVKAVLETDLPHAVREAALFNLSTLRSQTAFRTRDGRFFGWEGCGDHDGCCPGSCTHVWNYEQATGFLFGPLARNMRDTEFLQATRDTGHMSFRVNLPLGRPHWFMAAADGQMGTLMKLHREWQLSGDADFLKTMWPNARKALAFCWVEGGWDADQDGVMEGCQHNTMDVEYFGPNPQMTGWYLGALRAGEEMARYLGDTEFADKCRALFESGSKWMDEHLFNGDYYEHEIRPIPDEKLIAPGLRAEGMGSKNLVEPDLQLGAGCLIDQLIGQYQAHINGLGYLLDRQHVKKTLRSILKHNRRKTMRGHFNHMRTFALQEESAVLMASYPRGRRPKRPFPYYNEVMTGFEYTVAAGMMLEGDADLVRAGIEIVAATRARYDGLRRSPFDEAECGHHYARAMASWASVIALTGYGYSAVTGVLTIRLPRSGKPTFFSTGDAWGTIELRRVRGRRQMVLRVGEGQLRVRKVVLTGVGQVALPKPAALHSGQSVTAWLDLDQAATVASGRRSARDR